MGTLNYAPEYEHLEDKLGNAVDKLKGRTINTEKGTEGHNR